MFAYRIDPTRKKQMRKKLLSGGRNNEHSQKRDAETWHKITQVAIKGLNVTICQLVGDGAAGLTKLATKILNVIKGPLPEDQADTIWVV